MRISHSAPYVDRMAILCGEHGLVRTRTGADRSGTYSTALPIIVETAVTMYVYIITLLSRRNTAHACAKECRFQYGGYVGHSHTTYLLVSQQVDVYFYPHIPLIRFMPPNQI